MGLLGGWWGVGAIAVVVVFLILELLKYQRGMVALTARQKVVRVLGGILLLAIVLMTIFSPLVLVRRPGMAHLSFDVLQATYWSIALLFSILLLVMALMDASEVSRQYMRGQRSIRRGTVTKEDIERILAAERKDNPEDVGRRPEDR